MIPKRQQRGRWGSLLSASVLCSLVSVGYCGTRALEQTPAQDRFFESLLGGSGWGSAPAPPPAPPMNIPDVAGFGMYPLWKFHKFDGLSLRPVPYGVDIGSGIPPSPVPPAYPTGFLSSPSQQANNAPYYGPPSNPPAASYEAAAPAQSAPQPNYSNSAPAQNYGNPAPQQISYQPVPQQQSYNAAPQQSYGSSAPSYGMSTSSYQPEAQPTNGYQPNTINLSYSPVQQAPAVKYNDAPQSYNAPAAPSYGEQQAYSPPQTSYGAPMNSAPAYDNYGAGNGITIQFSAAPQDYQQQQQPSSYGGVPSGAYSQPMPSYTAIESPMAAQYPTMQDSKPMQMDGYGGGGFMKRNSPGFEKDSSKTTAESDPSSSDGGYKA